jgi:DNA-binding transcriptional regulator YiaG
MSSEQIIVLDASERKNLTAEAAAEAVRGIRLRLGFTQEQLAHALGITVSTVNRWENAHARPSALAWTALGTLAARHVRNGAAHDRLRVA